MYLFDTDHITALDRGGEEGERLRTRLAHVPPEEAAVSVVSYEEQMRGWLAYIAQMRAVDRQVAGYHRLERMLEFYCATLCCLLIHVPQSSSNVYGWRVSASARWT